MIYRCTVCDWRGEEPQEEPHVRSFYTMYTFTCPVCNSPVEDLDSEERAGIRQYDGGLSREEAERKAKEDMEKLNGTKQ